MDQSVQKQLTATNNTSGTTERKEYSGVPLKIIKLLGTGLLPAEVARAVGVDESYISQLQKEESFIQQVNELVTKTFADQSEIDDNYVEVERVLSKRLRENAPILFNQDQLLRTLKFANEAKKKMAPANHNSPGDSLGGIGKVVKAVTLILPIAVVKEFMLNPNNEIIGVGGEELTTLPSANINNLVEKNKDKIKNSPTKMVTFNVPRQTDPYSDL